MQIDQLLKTHEFVSFASVRFVGMRFFVVTLLNGVTTAGIKIIAHPIVPFVGVVKFVTLSVSIILAGT